MKSASREVQDQMNLVARVVERLCQLPAAPAADWCQRAAAELLPMAGGTVSGVMVASYDSSGRVDGVEDAGAASGSASSRETLERVLEPTNDAWTLSTLGDNGSRVVRVVETASLSAPAADHWRAGGVEALVIASEALWSAEPARRATVVVGTRSADGTPAPAVASVIGAVARRVGLAFGRAPLHPAARLTAREMEVLERLLLGLSIKRIAEEMGRSPHTVHDHVKSLHTKMGATSRGALVARALGHLGPNGRSDEDGGTGAGATPGGLRAVVKPVSLASLRV
jgi:DNA-binding CsgD family transcriptional regulator